MTSREIMRRTLEFENPERVARSFSGGDLHRVGMKAVSFATEWAKVPETGEWLRTDLWGNTWRRIDEFSKGEVWKGVIQTTEDIYSYIFPQLGNPAFFEHLKEARAQNSDRWMSGGIPGLTFVVARDMLKLENYLEAILAEKEHIHNLHDRIDEILVSIVHRYGEIGCDSVAFGEDWGTQRNTLISPALWREEFYPRYKRICDTAHSYGMKVLMHSCGAMTAIISGCIDAGIDAFLFDQPEIHGIETLAGFQKNAKVTFMCPVDIQTTLQSRDENKIRSRAREMLDALWCGRGGFIADRYGSDNAIGLEPRWQDIACDEFIKYGVAETYGRK